MAEMDHEVKKTSFEDADVEAMDTDSSEMDAFAIPDNMVTNRMQRLANRFQRVAGVEARGIERVDEGLRTGFNTASDWMNMTTIWFSVNLTANILSKFFKVIMPLARSRN